VRSLAEERGMTVLISSHNLPELFQTATDYLIVEAGELRMTLTLAELEAQTQQYLRSEEHTSELQSRFDLVCRLLLEKKKQLLDTGDDATFASASAIHKKT